MIKNLRKIFIPLLLCVMATVVCAACNSGTQSSDNVHNFTHYPAVEATCEEGGNTEYWVCDDCGKWFADENGNQEITDHSTVEIPALEHNLIKHPAVEATCEEGGNTEYWVCDGCGKWFADENGSQVIADHSTVEIPALEHNLINHPAVEATCEEGGNTEYWVCDDCGKWFADESGNQVIADHSSVEIPALEHNLINHPAVEATCEEGGNTEYWVCDDCGKWFADESGSEEIADHDSVTVHATGHTFDEVWTYDDEYHYHKATCGHEVEDEKVKHQLADGRCTICGYEQGAASQGLEFSLNSDNQSYSVTGIGECTDSDIIIPSTYGGLPVTVIGFEAFYGCSDFSNVVIPDSVTTVEANAFYWCSGLKSVVVGDGVTSIGARAFGYCLNMESIVIGSSVTSIGDDQFVNCSAFSLYYKGTEEDWNQIKIGESNTELLGVTPYYYSETKPSADYSSYWHYDEDGITPVLWKDDD